jgi:hypothetical protein
VVLPYFVFAYLMPIAFQKCFGYFDKPVVSVLLPLLLASDCTNVEVREKAYGLKLWAIGCH